VLSKLYSREELRYFVTGRFKGLQSPFRGDDEEKRALGCRKSK
jgi:hypothetical protein